MESRIMVVEGSAVARELVTRSLAQQMGEVEITACGSGEEALRRLDDGRYSLITTALMLEDMDGLELCRSIRANPGHHYTPIIVISGDADHRLLKEGFAAGVTDYFDKSLGYPAFGEFIKTFSQRNRGLVGRVLFVEDGRTAAAVTIRTLERQGLQVVHTASAEEALELLQRSRAADDDDDFDLVITDFHLTGEMTGGDLLHAVRTRLKYSVQELPLLVITGNDDHKTQVEVFHAGANDFVNKPLVEEILMARVRSLRLIKQQYTALMRQTRDLERLATSDTLTGTRNRRYLYDQGGEWLGDSAQQPLGVMLMDIDHFKAINDGYGHQTGDHVLIALGAQLNASFEDGMAVRYGGEEFAVLLPNCPADALQSRGEALRAAVAELHPKDVPVTLSIGLCQSSDHPEADLDALLHLADLALYAAKGSGRNRVCLIHGDRSIITTSSGE